LLEARASSNFEITFFVYDTIFSDDERQNYPLAVAILVEI